MDSCIDLLRRTLTGFTFLVFIVVVGFSREGDGKVCRFARGYGIRIEDGEVEFDGGVFVVGEGRGVAELSRCQGESGDEGGIGW